MVSTISYSEKCPFEVNLISDRRASTYLSSGRELTTDELKLQ
jgi:hypothetical protein